MRVREFVMHDCPQRSPEWFALRAGKLTGSAVKDLFSTLKSGGEPAGRRDLRTRIVIERLTGRPQEDDYENADMRRGRELEPLARAAYEARTGLLVEQSGFLSHTTLPIGCSLDGHVGDFDGIVELKAPRSARHLAYIRGGDVPAEHRYQIVHNLFVTGAPWCDFVSFDPTMPDTLQLFIVRVEADPKELSSYELLLRKFLAECDTEYEAVAKLATEAVA